jgi:hypothetical protein
LEQARLNKKNEYLPFIMISKSNQNDNRDNPTQIQYKLPVTSNKISAVLSLDQSPIGTLEFCRGELLLGTILKDLKEKTEDDQ